MNECPRLETLDVDCKADLNHQLFEVLSHRALRPRKLTLQHKQRLTSASTGDRRPCDPPFRRLFWSRAFCALAAS